MNLGKPRSDPDSCKCINLRAAAARTSLLSSSAPLSTSCSASFNASHEQSLPNESSRRRCLLQPANVNCTTPLLTSPLPPPSATSVIRQRPCNDAQLHHATSPTAITTTLQSALPTFHTYLGISAHLFSPCQHRLVATRPKVHPPASLP